MGITEDREKIKEWVPLMVEGRTSHVPIALSRDESGTDVNFGALTKLISNLKERNVEVSYKQEVENIEKLDNGNWKVTVKDLNSGQSHTYESEFVFIGAGGKFTVTSKTGIKQSKHIGGFPVSGLFLRCTNKDVIENIMLKFTVRQV